MIKVNDYVYLFPFEERRDRPNIGVIVGKNFNVLVDFGISEIHINEVLNDFVNNGIDYPLVGVLTHYHYDHSFGLPYFNGISIGCKRSNDYLKVLSNVKMSDSFIKSYLSGESLEFCYKAICEEYEDLSSIKVKCLDICFSSYLKLDLGDKIVELFHVPTPHCDDAVFVKVNDILFIGDAFFYDIFNGEKCFNKEKLKSFYALIDSFEVSSIIQGHNFVMSKEELLREIQQLLN